MIRLERSDLEHWLKNIVERCEANCNRVMRRIEPDADVSAGATARALLTGNAAYLLSPEDCFDWGSWVETMPVSHVLVRNQQILVDLIPCRTEEAFRFTYGCTPWQMLRLFLQRNEVPPILFNVRNLHRDANGGLDIGEYLDEGCVATLGPILMLSEDHPSHFYCLEIIRDPLFDTLGKEHRLFSRCRDDALALLDDYGKSTLQGEPPQKHHGPECRPALSRQGNWPGFDQAAGRLAYYMAYRKIDPDACDEVLDDCIQAGRFALGDGDRLSHTADVIGRINIMHQINTAPITGALGGRYTSSQSEFSDMAKVHWSDELTGVSMSAPQRGQRIRANEGFAEWLVRTLAGATDDPTTKETLAISQLSNSLELSGGILNDRQWDRFLLYRRTREAELEAQSRVQSAFEALIAAQRRETVGGATVQDDPLANTIEARAREYEGLVRQHQEAARSSNTWTSRCLGFEGSALDGAKSLVEKLIGGLSSGDGASAIAASGAVAGLTFLGAPALASAMCMLGWALRKPVKDVITSVTPLHPERRDVVYFIENLRLHR